VPLFVEEVTRLLLERGEQGGIHTIPPTLQQSLMARLDRLGPAREVAQIGAVIGRGFSYGLLRDVTGLEDAPLQAALERLAEADILLVQGLPPESDYRFKHALIQDAAYENLLKSRRQVLHRRVAEILRDRVQQRRPSRKRLLIISHKPAFPTPPSNGGARPATRRCAAPPSRRRSPISARRSRWRTRPATARLRRQPPLSASG
jgi:predicted ATPase